MFSYEGNDTLNGGVGNDTLSGGTGIDTFRFDTLLSASTNLDVLADFSVQDDTIELENGIFTSLTSTGTLAANQFVIGTAAQDSNDYLIYNATTGALYYDADGTGATAAVQFASLSIGLAMAAGDFMVA